MKSLNQTESITNLFSLLLKGSNKSQKSDNSILKFADLLGIKKSLLDKSEVSKNTIFGVVKSKGNNFFQSKSGLNSKNDEQSINAQNDFQIISLLTNKTEETNLSKILSNQFSDSEKIAGKQINQNNKSNKNKENHIELKSSEKLIKTKTALGAKSKMTTKSAEHDNKSEKTAQIQSKKEISVKAAKPKNTSHYVQHENTKITPDVKPAEFSKTENNKKLFDFKPTKTNPLNLNETTNKENQIKDSFSEFQIFKKNNTKSGAPDKIDKASSIPLEKEIGQKLNSTGKNVSQIQNLKAKPTNDSDNLIIEKKPAADTANNSLNKSTENSTKVEAKTLLIKSGITNSLTNSTLAQAKKEVEKKQKNIQEKHNDKANFSLNKSNNISLNKEVLSHESLVNVKRKTETPEVEIKNINDKAIYNKISEKNSEVPVKTNENGFQPVKQNNLNVSQSTENQVQKVDLYNAGIESKTIHPLEGILLGESATLNNPTANNIVNSLFTTTQSVLSQIVKYFDVAKSTKPEFSQFEIELGKNEKFEIRFTKMGDTHSAKIIVGSESTLQVIEKIMPELKIQLENKGIQFMALDVEMKQYANENRKNENQKMKNTTLNHNYDLNVNSDEQLVAAISHTRNFGYNTIEITA